MREVGYRFFLLSDAGKAALGGRERGGGGGEGLIPLLGWEEVKGGGEEGAGEGCVALMN